jgi:hypothetical protein
LASASIPRLSFEDRQQNWKRNHKEAVAKAVELGTSCYEARVAGTSYVPVPKAQEVYSLTGLSGNKANSRISARVNLLSLRDPDPASRGNVGATQLMPD